MHSVLSDIQKRDYTFRNTQIRNILQIEVQIPPIEHLHLYYYLRQIKRKNDMIKLNINLN